MSHVSVLEVISSGDLAGRHATPPAADCRETVSAASSSPEQRI